MFRYSKSFFFKLNNDGLITGIYIFVFDLSAMTDRSLPYASANKMSSLYISVMVVVNGAVFFCIWFETAGNRKSNNWKWRLLLYKSVLCHWNIRKRHPNQVKANSSHYDRNDVIFFRLFFFQDCHFHSIYFFALSLSLSICLVEKKTWWLLVR